jgi:hypothetical protein
MHGDPEQELSAVGADRRAFLRKMGMVAFAAPVVASFSMAGIQAVYAQTPTTSGQRPTPTSGGTAPTTSSSSTTTTTIGNGNLRRF